MKNRLLPCVLTGVGLVSGLVGCDFGDNGEYHFNGKIGEEQVHFYESRDGIENYLEVVKADGSIVKYGDTSGNDLKIEYFEIIVGDKRTWYNASFESPGMEEIVQGAHEEFDEYLKKITDIETAPLYE